MLQRDPRGQLSGITKFIDRYKHVKKAIQIKVKTITLQTLLQKYKAPNIIHYFSLDTEGTELEILKSVDFSKYTFLYITVEHNFIKPRRNYMRRLLLNNGYLFKGHNKVDDDYIHEITVIGTYYYRQNYTKPILIKRKKVADLNHGGFSVSSPYWKDDVGKFEKGFFKMEKIG